MNHLDLFSGIGGFALAARRVGWKTRAFCEIEPFCQLVLARHWEDVPIFDDVEDLYIFADSLPRCPDCEEPFCMRCGVHYWECNCVGPDQFQCEIGDIDVITAGFPCQDISLMQEISPGQGKGIEGERSGLWRETARLICQLRPKYAVLENVTALLVRGLDRVTGDLASFGYDCEWHCIPAAYIGAPHRRDRVWIVAYPHDQGLERYAGDGDGRAGWADAFRSIAAGGFPPGESGAGFWEREPAIHRMADGIPDRVDRSKALGNAIVPQIAELIFRAINERESGRLNPSPDSPPAHRKAV